MNDTKAEDYRNMHPPTMATVMGTNNALKPMLEISVSEGKYTVIQDHRGSLRALRCGEEWPARNLAGDNLVLSLAYELEAMRERHDKITNMLSRYLIASRERVPASWVNSFAECEAIVINKNLPHALISPVLFVGAKGNL